MKTILIAMAFILYMWAVTALGLGPFHMATVMYAWLGPSAIFGMAIYTLLIVAGSMFVLKKLVEFL